MPDVFLFPGEANPNDVKLRDPTSGGAPPAQSVLPDLIANPASIYEPTFTLGNVNVEPGLIDNGSLVYAPGLAQTVTPGLIAAGTTVHGPTVAPGGVSVTPALIAQGIAVHAPTFTLGNTNVSPDRIDDTALVYGPTVVLTLQIVEPPLIASTTAIHEPGLGQSVSPDAIDQSAVTFTPTVSPGGVSVAPDLIDQSAAIFDPSVEIAVLAVYPDLLGASTVYTPVIEGGAQPVSQPHGPPLGAARVKGPAEPRKKLTPRQLLSLPVIARNTRIYEPILEQSDDEWLLGLTEDDLIGVT